MCIVVGLTFPGFKLFLCLRHKKTDLYTIFESEFMVGVYNLSWGYRRKAFIMQNGSEAVQHHTAFNKPMTAAI